MSLGLGSVIASAVDTAPWITLPGRYKGVVFVLVGAILVFNYWFVIARGRRPDCKPGELCHPSHPGARVNRVMFWVSVAIYVIAVSAAYGAAWWVGRQT